MGTAKFDESTPDNPKLIDAGPIAAWLWFCGVLYCRRTLTDGFIPKRKVPHLFTGLSNPFRHAARLVEVGLWHDAVGGYQVNDFLDHNPSKSAMDEYRRKDRERKQSRHGIHEQSSNGFQLDSERIPNDVPNAGGTHAGAKSESESGGSRSAAEKAEPARVNPAAPTKALLTLFDELHQQRLGTKAAIDGGKDAAILAKLWQQRQGDPITLEDLIRAFFASKDAFVTGAGFTVGVFKSQVGKLLTHVARGRRVTAETWQQECERLHHDPPCLSHQTHFWKVERAARAAQEPA